jgi:glucokinase
LGDTLLLAGDTGGTKIDMAIYSASQGLDAPMASTTVRSADFADLESAACAFVASAGVRVDEAVFGVAGPVVEGRATGTNLPWSPDEASLAKALGARRATLLNDLQAIANAVPHLRQEHLYTLNVGTPQDGGALAVVAPGTGMGQAFLTWEDGGYRPHPSEGGHASFAPNSDLEVALLAYLRKQYGHVSVERVCSGRWMVSLYQFLRDQGYAKEPAWLAERLAEAEDPTPVIVAAAVGEQACELGRQTLALFVHILGAAAGNLALTVMATGGIYLAGGMSLRLKDAIAQGPFMEAFVSKGRLSYLVERMPVHIVTHPQPGLLGAAAYGLESLRTRR